MVGKRHPYLGAYHIAYNREGIVEGLHLDLKSDAKVSIPGSLAELENGVFTKTDAIQKRNGYKRLSNEIENSAGYITSGKALSTRACSLSISASPRASMAGST